MKTDAKQVVKCYLCGCCGRPTDQDGAPLLIYPPDADYSVVEENRGHCCRNKYDREIAMDEKDIHPEEQWNGW